MWKWLVAGGRWLVAGGWWLVAGGRWLVAGGWWWEWKEANGEWGLPAGGGRGACPYVAAEAIV